MEVAFLSRPVNSVREVVVELIAQGLHIGLAVSWQAEPEPPMGRAFCALHLLFLQSAP